MNRFLVGSILLASLLLGAIVGGYQYRKTDAFARYHVLSLVSDRSQCTGIEIEADSGKVYTLTAAHCAGVVQTNNTVEFISEDKRTGSINVLAIDAAKDLMLLDGVTLGGLHVGSTLATYQTVHTMAHGLGYPAYRTDGVVLSQDVMTMPPNCSVTGCLVYPLRVATNAPVVPGASGGPLLDDSNNVVGVIHMYNQQYPIFSLHVSVKDIKEFMAGR